MWISLVLMQLKSWTSKRIKKKKKAPNFNPHLCTLRVCNSGNILHGLNEKSKADVHKI